MAKGKGWMTTVEPAPDAEAVRRHASARRVGTEKAGKKDRQFVTSLARGLALLRAFSNERRELGSSAIARLTNLPQPTVWRLCNTLREEGYLLIAPGGDRFQLSPAVLSLGYSALASIPLAEIAKPSLKEIADRFAAGCSLGVRDGASMLLVQRCQGENATLVLNLHVGSRLPLAESAMGVAYIAALDETDRRELLQEIKASDEHRWPRRKEQIDKGLREFRKTGYLTNCGEFHTQINTVAVGFKSSDGRTYAMTCGTPSDHWSLATMHSEVAPHLLQLARALGGGAPP